MNAWPGVVRGTLLSALLAIPSSCGATQPATPIVGGSASAETDFPYFVHVGEQVDPFPGSPTFCDGSVIAPEWVLTAAHCTEGSPTIRVRNVHGASQPDGKVFPDPLWDKNTDDGHDLALVHVISSVTTGVAAIPVGDPWHPASYAAGGRALIMGTGHPDSQFRSAQTVLRANNDMDDLYNSLLGTDHWNPTFMIGAGTPGQTTCDGDSGGPLVATPTNWHPVQVGVASFGPADCHDAGVFAKLDGAQLAWIASVVPSITQTWGTCVNSLGMAGLGQASYGQAAVNGPNRDGGNYWNIRCQTANATFLQARHSGLCANVIPGDQDGANSAIQGGCDNNAYNLLELDARPDGFYRIVVAATERCLGVKDASLSLRARIYQYTCVTDAPNEEWSLHRTDEGYFTITAKHSGLCLDVEGDYVGPGAFLWQYTCDNGYNQQFKFVQPPCPIAEGPTPDARFRGCVVKPAKG